MAKTVFFYTLGCKVNQYETEVMREQVEARGFHTAVYQPGESTVGDGAVVVNSCTVTGESDRKLRQLLRRCRRENPQAVLAVTGCFPQAFPAQAAALDAELVLGNAQRAELAERLEAQFAQRERVCAVAPHPAVFEPLAVGAFAERTRAFVKIEDGCNRFCSYCIIPYARGRVRSKPLDALDAELRTLAAGGYREVVLVGIHLTAYGTEQGGVSRLPEAVEVACAVPGIERVRLGSLEPDHVDEAMIARLAQQDKLCGQFHVALQSGCDATLRRMNRHYTAAQYRAVCEGLRRAFPGCAITTDVMVGFPGETEEEFAQSLALVQELGFARVHAFPYSPRPGTPAAQAAGQVPAAEKQRRMKRLLAVAAAGRAQFEQALVGRVVPVLCEEQRPDGRCSGHTDTYVPVLVAGGVPGAICRVRLTARDEDTLFGTVEA